MSFASMNSRFGAAVAALIALVVFGAQVARSQILADVLILKSGEKVEGRITAESDLSLTISTENSTGKAERMIPRSEISGVTRSEPLAPAKTPNPDSPEPPDRGSVSPDKKWEYRGPEDGGPKIVKAGTSEMAGDLSDVCGIGSCGEGAAVLWAPDSKRFAFNWGQGRSHNTSLYQLHGEEWKALKSPDDEVFAVADKIIAAQLKRNGLSEKKLSKEKMYLRLIWWTPKVRRWVDSNTAILFASLQQVTALRDSPGEMFDHFGADVLFTLRFDDAGNWKIVKTHRMSKKEVEEEQ
jgi:hypothetical protein